MATPVTVSATTDCVVATDLTVPGAVVVNLPAGSDKQVFFIVDGKGDAATNNITINRAGSDTIAGSTSLVLNVNRQAVMLIFNASDTDWKIAYNSRVISSIVSTDNAAARFDGTNGTLQNSGVIIDDSNNVTGIVALTTTGDATLGPSGATNATHTLRGKTVVLKLNANGSGDVAAIDWYTNTVFRGEIYTDNSAGLHFLNSASTQTLLLSDAGILTVGPAASTAENLSVVGTARVSGSSAGSLVSVFKNAGAGAVEVGIDAGSSALATLRFRTAGTEFANIRGDGTSLALNTIAGVGATFGVGAASAGSISSSQAWTLGPTGATAATRNSIYGVLKVNSLGTGTQVPLFFGASSNNYPGIGYNAEPTTTANQYTRSVNDIASVLNFGNNVGSTDAFEFHGFASGSSSPITASSANMLGSVSTIGEWKLGIGGSTDQSLQVEGVTTLDANAIGATSYILAMKKTDATTSADGNYLMSFGVNNAFNNSGRISTNGANAAAFFSTSDSRLKQNIESYSGGLDVIAALRPVEFEWISHPGEKVKGFVAQEVKPIVPEAVSSPEDPENTHYNMCRENFIPYLVSAIKELKQQFDDYVASHP